MKMLKVGDVVRVLAEISDNEIKLFPIGTIGEIIDSDNSDINKCYEVKQLGTNYTFWYYEHELEKGHLKTTWVKDE
jgi:hypothetical protein